MNTKLLDPQDRPQRPYIPTDDGPMIIIQNPAGSSASIPGPEYYFTADGAVAMPGVYVDNSSLLVHKQSLPDDLWGQLTDYITSEFDNIRDKLRLSQESLAWAINNKLDAARAVSTWVRDNPDQAAEIGINVASLFPLVRSLNTAKKVVETINTPQHDIVFDPRQGGFTKVDRSTITAATDVTPTTNNTKITQPVNNNVSQLPNIIIGSDIESASIVSYKPTPIQQQIEQATGVGTPELQQKQRDSLGGLQDLSSWLESELGESSTNLNPVNIAVRTGAARKIDIYHNFNEIIDNYDSQAQEFNIKGGDGRVRILYQIEGSLNSKIGVFEWIVEGSKVTHRRFTPSGRVTGIPNQITEKK
ncbi:MAG: hypothetical protein Tsb006_7250 [Rickettsiaceae bacterium]